jgi:hypothetical protein
MFSDFAGSHPMGWLWHLADRFWNIPGGIATVCAGILAIAAAFIAWHGVRRQILAENAREKDRQVNERSQETDRQNHVSALEQDRRDHEISALKTGLRAELMVFTGPAIEALSIFNQRTLRNPKAAPDSWPLFLEPKVYNAVVGRIGLITEGWPAAAIITFYANIADLDQMSREPMSGPKTRDVTNEKIAARLRLMAFNLAAAYDGLLSDRPQGIPQDLDFSKLVAADGTVMANVELNPPSLQSLLRRMAG